MNLDFQRRIAAKVPTGSTDECWFWGRSFAKHRSDYGRISIDGKNRLAHRVAYEAWVKPISAGMTIDHLCRNIRCVNPWHLEEVGRGENVLRGIGPTAVNARKETCRKGHVLELDPGSPGKRFCRTCRIRTTKLWRDRTGGIAPRTRAALSPKPTTGKELG